VVGICFLKKGRPFLAGAPLAAATLLRIFPAVVLAAVALAALAAMLGKRAKRLDAFALRFLLGATASLAILLSLSFLAAGGGSTRWSAWSDFARNARKHLATPLTNNMGLTTLLSYRPETRAARLREDGAVDPFEHWKDVRRRAAAAARPFALAAGLLALGALAWRLRDRPPWIVAAAAVGLVPIGTDLTCYYHACLFVLALLAVERAEVGIAALAYAAASCLVPSLLSWDEDRYAFLSALEIALVAFTWVLAMKRAKGAAAAASPRRSQRGPRAPARAVSARRRAI
jgi:hypothetical protein